MGKIRSIQALRAIAVLAVVCAHAFDSKRGTSGVDLFFVISGFIIARVSSGRSASEFIKARLWRIFPVYWLAALPYVAWMVLHGTPDAAKIAATISLWPVWGGSYQEPLLPVAWSLYFEMLFYAAVTLVLVSRRLAIVAAAAVLVAALAFPGPATAFILSPIIVEFLAGYGLARVKTFRFAAPALAIGLVALFALDRGFEGVTMLDPTQAGLRLLMFGVPAALVVYGALGLEPRFTAPWSVPLVLIGDESYSIYLTHLMVILAPFEWNAPAKVAAAVLVGLIAYRLVEQTLGKAPAPRVITPVPAKANAALTSCP
jgi:exopolysaccharide production protein ExoZ